MTAVRDLILVLGDQLSLDSRALRQGDPEQDLVVMAEVEGEAQLFSNHKQRVVLFLAAMRHFRDALRERGWRVEYQSLQASDREGDKAASTLPAYLQGKLAEHGPRRVVLMEAGRDSLEKELHDVARAASVPLEILDDDHFFASREDFARWAEGRKTLTMEYFYRQLRRQTGYLMEGKEPSGGTWNFDQDNRKTFGKKGPPDFKAPIAFQADAVTQEVLDLVEERFADLPGSLEAFDWPVTHEEAQRAVGDFIEHRLPTFGDHQDAMWTGRPFLSHSRISTALNLKLVDPRDVLDKAEEAFREGRAPINAVEGFVRQILGWREYMRGIYWLKMPEYLEVNTLDAELPLPELFWTGDTEMACLREVVGQLLDYAYAHHIQRLMVTGLFTLLAGVRPQEVHDWFMALYVDSVEWVTLPNVVGMSQYADGGVVGSKPYIASGNYVKRMSNYCQGCRFDPSRASGAGACPFTTLYWDFLRRHRERFEHHPRMKLQVRNLDRKNSDERLAISRRAEEVLERLEKGEL